LVDIDQTGQAALAVGATSIVLELVRKASAQAAAAVDEQVFHVFQTT
jgi:hypothetical protein